MASRHRLLRFWFVREPDVGCSEMPKQVTAQEVHAVLRQNLRKRPDLGLRNAVADGVLEPASPFEPQAVRPPRRWFVLLGLLMVLAVGCFVYFNLLH
jgi:hypothetical protein